MQSRSNHRSFTMRSWNKHRKAFTLMLSVILCLPAALCWALTIESIEPNIGQMGTAQEVTIRGTGFSPSTRVALIPETGNRQEILGSVTTGGGAPVDVKVNCATAYLLDQFGFRIIDISDPTQPSLVSSLEIPDVEFSRGEIAIVDKIAYVAGAEDLLVIDITDPQTPRLINSVPVPDGAINGYTTCIQVVDSIAYVAGNDLVLIDVDPTSPNYLGIIGFYEWGGGVDIVVKNSIAYIATDSNRSLKLFDVSNPQHPYLLGSISTDGDALSVAVEGSIAFVGNIDGLLIVDVSDPETPVPMGSYAEINGPWDLLLRHNILYCITLVNIELLDVSNPAHPFSIGTIADADRGVAFIDGTPYVTVGFQGLSILDVSDVSKPTIIGSVTPNMNFTVSIDSTRVYGTQYSTVNGTVRLVMFDFSDLADLKVTVTPVTIDGVIHDAKIVGNRAYFTFSGTGDLRIYDISDLANPIQLGSYSSPFSSTIYLTHFDVAGGTAYVLDSTGNMEIVDVSNPAVPQYINHLKISGDYRGDIAVVGSVAYAVMSTIYDGIGFKVIDVSNPMLPAVLGSYAAGSDDSRITVADNIAYVVLGDYFWRIFDVSDPQNPLHLGDHQHSSEWSSHDENITVVGDNAYILTGTGLSFFDISDPVSPKLIGRVDTIVAQGVSSDGRIVFGGATIIPAPLEVTSVDLVSDNELVALLPPPLAGGNYNIRIFDDSGNDQLLGAIVYQEQLPKAKAIIAAGYGPHENKVWNETMLNASHAYQVLVNQGYNKENIRYLSSVSVDVDNDSVPDVFGDTTLNNLEQSISSWGADADDLLIYLIGHGSYENFVTRHTDSIHEVLTARILAGWLNNLQSVTQKRIVCLYDACYSGSFVEPVKKPNGQTFERMLLTSSTANKIALLGNNGLSSFSYRFWEHVLEGKDLTESFTLAADFMEQYNQTALIDGNCDGVPNTPSDRSAGVTIGRGYNFRIPPKPYITCYSPNIVLADSNSADFWVKTISAYPIAKVWAEIIPPSYNPLAFTTPELPTFDLVYSAVTERYEGSYDEFVMGGTYLVSFYAIDDQQTISLSGVTKVTLPSFPWPMFMPAITNNAQP